MGIKEIQLHLMVLSINAYSLNRIEHFYKSYLHLRC